MKELVASKGRSWYVSGVVWAVLFGVVHLAWAVGSRFALVEVAAAELAFEQLWSRVYNLSVAAASFVLAAAALAHLRGLWAARMEGMVRAVIWAAAVVLLLRGVLGAGQLLWVSLFSVRTNPLLTWSVDLYMLLGGSVFLAAALVSRAAPAATTVPDTPDRRVDTARS